MRLIEDEAPITVEIHSCLNHFIARARLSPSSCSAKFAQAREKILISDFFQFGFFSVRIFRVHHFKSCCMRIDTRFHAMICYVPVLLTKAYFSQGVTHANIV